MKKIQKNKKKPQKPYLQMKLKQNLKGTTYTFHRGSTFVNEIENKFKELNKAEKPKPFSDINKWSPADIYAVKNGVRFDFNQYSSLGEFTNEFKEQLNELNTTFDVKVHYDNLINPKTHLNQTGNPYKVFTQFANQWKNKNTIYNLSAINKFDFTI